MNSYNMTNENISYMGRVTITEDKAIFYYPASCLTVKFVGKKLEIDLVERRYWGDLSIGYVVDGKDGKIPLSKDYVGNKQTITVCEFDEAGEHIVTIYKNHGGGNNIITLTTVRADGELVAPPEKPSLKLEVFGDSVSAGEVVEAEDYAGKSDPENHNCIYDNAYYSFPAQLSRMINAQLHNNSQGGIALLDGTGYYNMPDAIGLESTYNKECFVKDFGYTDWDFAKYIPDFVIIAMGQNDEHIEGEADIDISNPANRDNWKKKYKAMVYDLHSHYWNAKYILTTTLLMHDKEWDNCIEEIKCELRNEGIPVYHNVFTRNGAATPGHPRKSEDREMAQELAGFIRGIMECEDSINVKN